MGWMHVGGVAEERQALADEGAGDAEGRAERPAGRVSKASLPSCSPKRRSSSARRSSGSSDSSRAGTFVAALGPHDGGAVLTEPRRVRPSAAGSRRGRRAGNAPPPGPRGRAHGRWWRRCRTGGRARRSSRCRPARAGANAPPSAATRSDASAARRPPGGLGARALSSAEPGDASGGGRRRPRGRHRAARREVAGGDHVGEGLARLHLAGEGEEGRPHRVLRRLNR